MPQKLTDDKLLVLLLLFKSSSIVKNISEALIIMAEKRTTLEEKMISAYFTKLATSHGEIIEQIFSNLKKVSKKVPKSMLVELSELDDKLLATLEDFLKAARHDLNYLEQYFEYDYDRSLRESSYLEDSERLLQSLVASLHQKN